VSGCVVENPRINESDLEEYIKEVVFPPLLLVVEGNMKINAVKEVYKIEVTSVDLIEWRDCRSYGRSRTNIKRIRKCVNFLCRVKARVHEVFRGAYHLPPLP
jgi:hypothetical protein